MCKLQGEQSGTGFPPYRNFQQGEGIFPRYILPTSSASPNLSAETNTLSQILKKSLPKRARKARRRKPTNKNQNQIGAGQKRRRRKKSKSKPKKKRSRKSKTQVGGVRSLQKKKKKTGRKRVYKNGRKAVLNNNSNF